MYMTFNARILPNKYPEIDPCNVDLVFQGDPEHSLFPGFVGTEVETCGEVLRSGEEEEEYECHACGSMVTEFNHYDARLDPDDVASMFIKSFRDFDAEEPIWMFVSDCSIGGVEAVSHPRTYESILSDVMPGWAKLEKYFKQWEINSPYEGSQYMNAGMHVHLSVDAFKDDNHVKRFAQLCEMFYDKIVYEVGKRDTTGYCRRAGVSPGLEEDAFRDAWYEERAHREKFQIVNTSKSYTVEVRAFRAPQSGLRYLAYIQLCLVIFQLSVSKKVIQYRWSDVKVQAENMGFEALVSIL
jgi:hypothetical protein